jgi:hypothetical protein
MQIAGTVLEADLVRASLGPLFLISLAVIHHLGRNKVGRLFMTIGVLHIAGGLVVGREPVMRLFREGIIGEADSALGNAPQHMDKELAFWFLLWGVFTFLLGQVASWVEREGKRLPAHIGWQLVIVNVAAAILIPKGGFWLVLIPAYMIIRDASRPPPLARA